MNFVIKRDIVFWVEYKNKITTMYYNPEYGLGFSTLYVVNVDVKFQNLKKL